jgi:hypothetical protein
MTELLIGIFIGYAVGSFIVLAFYRMQDGFWSFQWMQNLENKLKEKT